ncbi:cell surface glycoprotein 1 [Brienomyrus brachyistius]|uniref:cell surface glycoprotein 1 n=1 Tax=Brienomyrus brachyistius TaxID=42636 RepID=UPI0020B1B896|nr:cell surface glycoprotein 1 [Brienomyrus brachyistius]
MPVSKSSKPKRPAPPLSASGEPPKEEEPQKPADGAKGAAVAVAASVAAAAEATPTEPQLAAEQEPVSVGPREEHLEPELDLQPTSTTEVEPVVETLAQEVHQAPPSVDVLLPPSSPPGPTERRSSLDDQSLLSPKISVAPKNLSPEMGEQEDGVEKVCKPVMEEDLLVPKNVHAELVDLVVQPELTTVVPAEGFTAETLVLLAHEPGQPVEKADEEINEDNDYGGDVEEEEKEVSQQISVSEMSGTQPTEDSRPGSAGLTGSMWRGGALVSELDSEDVSCSQQGASELSAPGVLEGTESLDDLGEASLKGADGEGASAGSPDLEIVPDIPANEEDEDEEDEEDRVCDMEVGSERAEDPRRARQEGEDEEEDEDVEMASEGVTESGLESYGNADEDDFAEDDRLDNLNRAQPPLLFSTAPAPHWVQANPLGESCTQPPPLAASALLVSPSSDPWQADPDTPIQTPAEPWMVLGAPVIPQVQEPVFHLQVTPEPRSDVQLPPVAPAVEENLMSVEPTGLPVPARGMSQSSTLSGTELAAQSSSDTSTPEELREYNSSSGVESDDKLKTPVPQQQADVEQDTSIPLERGEGEEEEAETLPADEVLGGPATAPTSDPSSPSASGDEASDTEGEMLVHDPGTLGSQTLPATEEREEAGQLPYGEGEDGGDTPQSANSVASYGFDCTTSNSNAHSTQSPGIFSLENEDPLLEETKDPTIKELTLGAATAEPPLGAPVDLLPLSALGEIQSNPEEQEYMLCGKLVAELPEQSPVGETAPPKAGLPLTPQEAREGTNGQPAYYSAICEKTDSVLAGGCELQSNQQPPPTQSQANHVGSVAWKTYSQPPSAHLSPAQQPTDLQSRTPQAQPNLQLRRLEQHQKHLQQIQERQEQQNRDRRKQLELEAELRELEEEENEEEDEEKLWREQRRKLEKQRQDLLQLQFQHQQQELKHRQQILQWQQELVQQQHNTQSAVLQSPTSVLCTIYEAGEASDEEEEKVGDDMVEEKNSKLEELLTVEHQEGGMEEGEKGEDSQVDQGDSKSPELAPLQRPTKLSPHADQAQLDLDWDKKVDIVQQLINQTLLLAGDGCPPLLLLPGGGGGTLSPLESSMWPTLLPPLTPPSATVTSVSSFSPEDQGSSPQGEWTVVELETHH